MHGEADDLGRIDECDRELRLERFLGMAEFGNTQLSAQGPI